MQRDLNVKHYTGLDSEKSQLTNPGDMFRAKDTGKAYLIDSNGVAQEVGALRVAVSGAEEIIGTFDGEDVYRKTFTKTYAIADQFGSGGIDMVLDSSDLTALAIKRYTDIRFFGTSPLGKMVTSLNNHLQTITATDISGTAGFGTGELSGNVDVTWVLEYLKVA